MNKIPSQPKSTIAVLGFSQEECEIINVSLSKNTMELFVAECATDLLVGYHLMIIIKITNVPREELLLVLDYYKQVPVFSETVIFIGNCEQLDMNSRIIIYESLDELQQNLKYLLLAAHKQRKNAENFSRSISYALIILKMITENPGISSKEISDRLEISPRSVTRYIETLNMAGESIVYNRKENGWSLEYATSLLKL